MMLSWWSERILVQSMTANYLEILFTWFCASGRLLSLRTSLVGQVAPVLTSSGEVKSDGGSKQPYRSPQCQCQCQCPNSPATRRTGSRLATPTRWFKLTSISSSTSLHSSPRKKTYVVSAQPSPFPLSPSLSLSFPPHHNRTPGTETKQQEDQAKRHLLHASQHHGLRKQRLRDIQAEIQADRSQPCWPPLT